MNKFGRFILGCFNILYPYKIIGKENLPDGAAILVCNHFRAIDCGFVADVSNKNTYFLAKSELFKNKLIGKIIRGLGGFPINRKTVDLKAIKTSIDLLNNGNKVVIFPEGTRNKTGTDELQEIKGGTAYIAVKAKVPIVPLIIYKKSRIFRKTYIMVGKTFDFSDFYNVKFSSAENEKTENIIREKMIETQKELKSFMQDRKNKKAENL